MKRERTICYLVSFWLQILQRTPSIHLSKQTPVLLPPLLHTTLHRPPATYFRPFMKLRLGYNIKMQSTLLQKKKKKKEDAVRYWQAQE